MKRFSSFGIRAKVLLLLALIFCTFTVYAGINIYRNFEASKLHRQSELSWAVRWAASEERRHVSLASEMQFLVINEIRKGLTEQDCTRGLVAMTNREHEFGRFAVADPDGNITCNSIPWLTDKNVAVQSYFREALQRDGYGYIGEADNRNPGQYAAVMSRATRDTHGTAQNVVLVEMDFSWVKEEADEISLPADGHLLLVDPWGKLVAGTPNLADWIDKSIDDTPYYKQVLAAKEAVFEGSGFAGADSMIVSRQFNSPSGEFRLILDYPDRELFAVAYHDLTRLLVQTLLAFFLFMVLAYFLIEKSFLHKADVIRQAIRKYQGGDLAARVDLADDDEFGQLARALNETEDTLQAKEEALVAGKNELYRANRALRVLSAGNKALVFAKTEQDMLERVCRDIVEEGGYLAAWIGFVGNENDRLLRPMASYSKVDDPSRHLDWEKAGNGTQPVITAVRENRVLAINDTDNESVHPKLAAQANAIGYRSLIVLPLHFEGSAFGALVIAAYRIDEFKGDHVGFLEETAADISFGIETLRLRSEKDRLSYLTSNHELMLRDSLEDALKAIALTIEMRDPYTAGHQRRVAELAQSIAIELGISEDETHGIYLAGIVHDIGKIGIPAELLVKPTRLSPMEYELIKFHAQGSYDILKGINFPWPIAEMARQHHERLDGKGYPQGLKGADILFGARILAVSDVVEAMTSHRPYRPGLGIDVALKEIKNGSGTIYDAVVVEACLKIFADGKFKF